MNGMWFVKLVSVFVIVHFVIDSVITWLLNGNCIFVCGFVKKVELSIRTCCFF